MKKILSLALASLVAAAFMAGCSKPAEEGAKPAETAGATTAGEAAK